MREEFRLAYNYKDLEQLLAGEQSIDNFLNELFGEQGSPNYRTMCEGLVAYHNKEGGSPEVTEFEMLDAGFMQDKLTGYVKCRFGIHFFYTCSDVHNNAADTIRWDFTMDETAHTIYFIGEEPWVRDAE